MLVTSVQRLWPMRLRSNTTLSGVDLDQNKVNDVGAWDLVRAAEQHKFSDIDAQALANASLEQQHRRFRRSGSRRRIGEDAVETTSAIQAPRLALMRWRTVCRCRRAICARAFADALRGRSNLLLKKPWLQNNNICGSGDGHLVTRWRATRW
mmetsp:Transcript_29675/g.69008  ORF Transcript_29675/g.69008 Transcript_29675/m.69008 type:complete len:152 (-) Transcript_29675:10-465(-)